MSADTTIHQQQPTVEAAMPGLRHEGLIATHQACDIRLPARQKLALIAITRCRDNRTGRSMISLDTIGQRADCCARQASRHVAALIKSGLVTKTGMTGKCSVYSVNIAALAQADTCKKSTALPVDNSAGTPDICDIDPGHLEQAPLTFATSTPDTGVHHSGWYSGFYSGEEDSGKRASESTAAGQADDLPPPFVDLGDLKTSEPEQKPEAAPIASDAPDLSAIGVDPSTIDKINEKRRVRGLIPMGHADLIDISDRAEFFRITPQEYAETVLKSQNNCWSMPARAVADALAHISDQIEETHEIQETTLAGVVSQALCKLSESILRAPKVAEYAGPQPATAICHALQNVANMISGESPAPISGLVTTPPPAAPAVEPRAVAIDPETLAAVNTQRAANNKAPLGRNDLAELGRQATLAGMAPQAAAEWILSKPTRSFFKAEWLRDKPAAQAAPAPIDEATRAQAKARAEQVQAELLRASIAAMRRDGGIVLPPSSARSAAPSAVRPPLQQTVTVRSAAPISVGEGSPASVKRSAEQWLDDYAAGRPLKVHQFEHALALTGRSRDELRAQRAAAKAALQVAIGGAA